MCQSVDTGRNGALAPFEGRHVCDGHLIKSMSFLYPRKERLVIEYRKSGETDTGSILDKDLDIVGSSGDLSGYEFGCLLRGLDSRIPEEETYKQVTARTHILSGVASLGGEAHPG